MRRTRYPAVMPALGPSFMRSILGACATARPWIKGPTINTMKRLRSSRKPFRWVKMPEQVNWPWRKSLENATAKPSSSLSAKAYQTSPVEPTLRAYRMRSGLHSKP